MIRPASHLLLAATLALGITGLPTPAVASSTQSDVQLAQRSGPRVKKSRKKALEQDLDGDGIPDQRDKCPGQKEDMDGFEDEDGCPEIDNDQDKVPDIYDRCPADAEDIDGFEDADGCPDPDNDQDGIPDRTDSCPDEPEDMDGFEDMGGCPDPDNDGDGIPDTEDRCPDKKGRKSRSGCPRR